MEEQSRLVNLGGCVDGRLTYRQIGIMDLRRQLLDFVAECGEFPVPPSGNDRIVGSLEWSNRFVAEVVAWAERYSTWARRISLGYRQKFAARVLWIVNDLMAEEPSVSVDALVPFTNNLGPREDFQNLINALQDIVWKLDQAAPFPRVNRTVNRVIGSMTADELLAAFQNSTLSRIVDEIPPQN
jgi:hypothetical protein